MMKFKAITSLILLLFDGMQLLATEATLQKEFFVLPNGLKVYLCPDHQQSKVFGLVMCKAGSKDDPDDATGVAHYMEHMLFKGTTDLGTVNWELEKPHIDSIFKLYDLLSKTKDNGLRNNIQQLINIQSVESGKFSLPDEFSNLVKSIGGTDMNAATFSDITVFYNTFPPNQINKWIDLYAHRFINPVFRSFQSELEIVYEEKNKRLDNFYSAFYEQFLKNFFKVHPYGQRSSLGSIEDLKNPSLTRMLEFYNAYYYANNMVLVLVGDFEPSQVRSWITEKFGVWKTGILPERRKYGEQPFNGREFIETACTPLEMGILGFRTVPKQHPDQIYLEVLSSLLSNSNKTGVLDKLTMNSSLLASQTMPLTYNDQDGILIAFAPKINGQTLNEAEQIILNELEKIKNGNIEPQLLEAIKIELYKKFQLSLEGLDSKAMIITRAEGRNQDIDEVLRYPQKLKLVSINNIIDIANKYLTNNYLAFYSHAGEVTKGKMPKPGFTPVVAVKGQQSVYGRYFNLLPNLPFTPSTAYFDTAVKTKALSKNVNLKCCYNSYNDIFSLSLRFGVGTEKIPNLQHAIELVFYSGTETMSLFKFKETLNEIGCWYDIKVDQNFLTVELQGPDKFLPKSISLLCTLISRPVPDNEQLKQIIDNIYAVRKLENSNLDITTNALLQYAMFGKQSDYLNRTPTSKINKLNVSSLLNAFTEAMHFNLDIYYTGQLNPDTVAAIISPQLDLTFERRSLSHLQIKPLIHYKKNTVFYIEKKGALQSKVYFYANGPNFTRDMEANCEAFNLYFGGDFSGLVMQEIRESRSLAYTTEAEMILPVQEKTPIYFKGYLGTQNDKAINAIETFVNLVRDMPRQPEKLKMTREYLLLSAITSKPGIRQLALKIDDWKAMGYTSDPLFEKYSFYNKLTFNDIYYFYETNLKYNPLAITIVGELNDNDKKQLSHFGKVIQLSESDLFR